MAGIPNAPVGNFVGVRNIGNVSGLVLFTKKLEKELLSKTTARSRIKVAEEIQKRLVKAIDTGRVKGIGAFARNKESTIAKKGFDWPLVENKDLRNSIKIGQGDRRKNQVNIRIGIPRRARNSKGESIQFIMREYLEPGTADIPSRPLFRWTSESLAKDRKFQEKMLNLINQDIEKLFNKTGAG